MRAVDEVIPVTKRWTIALSIAAAALIQPAYSEDVSQRTARVGIVYAESYASVGGLYEAIRVRLRELGWIEGNNLTIETRSADGRLDRLPALMGELIERRVDVIVTGGNPTVLAAKTATSTIPIVATAMSDPVGLGLVASLAHPEANLTGLSLGFAEGFAGKWLELLHEIVPRLSTLAIVYNPENKASVRYLQDLQAAASARGLKLRMIPVHDASRLERGIREARRAAQAAVVLPDPFVMNYCARIAVLAEKARVPAIYGLLPCAQAGGLMAYGVDLVANARRGAELADKILRGAKPGEIPIEQPTRLSLAVNLKAAKALGLSVPESILLRADEVIR